MVILTMTMNMRIVMNMNIYITDKNQEQLRQEDSMSGLINRLLEEHYDGLSSNGRTDGFEPSNLGSSPGEPAKTEVAPMVFACCTSKTRRCKHWEFNEVEGYWQNTLNDEVVDA